ncbi:Endonuclease IV [Paenibacillus algorifonticola]|uniref:Endonuclease IV n=1 Tax=Paenibacillus algorifonticola TaxID=684063 RepID=A0A1I2J1B4_9BACL|nr:deoxyribonuclease IV [Paenibacillus algorifonticola]SFF48445.1 Endonuclease IV [Paenibacillus algorifonticola]
MKTKQKLTKEELAAFFLEYKQAFPLKINPYNFKMWLERQHNIKVDRKTILARINDKFEQEKKNKLIKVHVEEREFVEVRNILSLIEDCQNDPLALRKLGNQLQRDFDVMNLLSKDKLKFEKENERLHLRVVQLNKEVAKLQVENNKLMDDVGFYSTKSDQLVALSSNSIYYHSDENIILKMQDSAMKFYPPSLKVIENPNSIVQQETKDPKVLFIEKLQEKRKKVMSSPTIVDKPITEEIHLIGGAFQDNNLVRVVEQCEYLDMKSAMIHLSTEVVNYFNSVHLPKLQLREGAKLIKQNCHPDFMLTLHSSLRLNLSNLEDKTIVDKSVKLLKKQIEIADNYYYADQLVIHPGSYIRINDYESGIKLLIESLNEVITREQDVKVVIENMAGKGTELGRNFYEIASILNGVKYNDKIKVCLDTCHLWDSGYDIKDHMDGVLTEIDKLIGTEMVSMLHINDSIGDRMSKLDRHANIGAGKIGVKALSELCKSSEFKHAVKILETPSIGGMPAYRHERRILEESGIHPNWIECIRREILLPFEEMYG